MNMRKLFTIVLTAGLLLAISGTANATISSFADGNWEVGGTWTGGIVPGLNDLALIDHTVTMDMVDGITGDETTLADVTVNSGGTFRTWMGDMIVGDFTLNGGTVGGNQRTMDLVADSVTINNVAGNVWTEWKNQDSKHAEIHTPTLSGTGDLNVEIGHWNQLFQLDVTGASGTTGFTGTINVGRIDGTGFLFRFNANAETDSAHLKINNSITEADASFGMTLNSYTYDWLETAGGTPATDDGTSYNGYDIRDGNVEVWLTDLTIGGFEVPSRDTAYTYAELAAMDSGNVANFLRSDGTDGTLGVVPSAVEPEPMGQLGILDLEANGGINPATGEPWADGDQYRFAFFTSATTTAESSDISTYNAWVQGLADATTVYDIGAVDGATWNVIGSTDAVDARDNTSTNPNEDGSGHAIFLLDGSTVVANDYADLWDGEIENIINLTELGTVSTFWPFTGTYTDGTEAPGHGTSFGALGDGGEIGQGQSDVAANWIWRAWTGAPYTNELQMYALSDPLTLVMPEPGPVAIAGVDFDDGSGGFDITPDDLNALDGITVSDWTFTSGGISNDSNAQSGRASAPVGKMDGVGGASLPLVGDAAPTSGVHSFSITIPDGVLLDLTSVEFDYSQATDSSNTRWLAFNTSLDSNQLIFSEVGPIRSALDSETLSLSGAQYEGLTDQTVVFSWYAGGPGSGDIDIDSILISGIVAEAEPEPAEPPTVINTGATGITYNAADLGGDLTAGVVADVTVYYGLTDGEMDTGLWDDYVEVLGGVSEGEFWAPVSGLDPETDYYYRMYATNTEGTDWADTAGEFTTLAAPVLAFGDMAIYREATAADAITTAEFDQSWDTIVREDGGFSLVGDDTIDLIQGGHYLVLYTSRFDSTGGSNRSEVQTQLNLDGTDLAIGWSQGFMRRSNGDEELITSGGGIIYADPGDDLILQSFRTDANSAGVQREPDASGIQLLKLDDTWDYLSLSLSSDQTGTPSGGWTDVVYDLELEYDTGGFTWDGNSGDITLVEGGHYMVFANTYFEKPEDGTRSAYEQRLTLDNAQIDGSLTTVYLRGDSNGNDCFEGATSIGMIIEATAGQVLSVEVAKETGSDPTIIGDRTALTIVKLPDTADYIRLSDTTAQDFNPDSSMTALGWDTEDELDAGSFTHTGSQVGVVGDGDYLFFNELYDGDDGNQRIKYWQRWAVDGADPLEYAGTGRYARNSESESVGNWSGVLVELDAGQYVEVVSERLGNSGTLSADINGLQGVSLSSLFVPPPEPEQPTVINTGAMDITLTTAELGGDLTAGVIADVYLYWGDDDGGTGTWDYVVDLGLLGEGEFSFALSGLDPDTDYYYRAYAENVVGSDWADSTVAFSTISGPPPPGWTILGTGSGALIGNDLTDEDNVHDENAYFPPYNYGGFNAVFASTDKADFGSQNSFQMFDNAVGGNSAKWCCADPGGDGHQLDAEFAEAVTLTSFTITSSNDSSGRDPSEWSIEGSNDGINWFTIYEHDYATHGVVWDARDQVALFEGGTLSQVYSGDAAYVTPTTAYTYIRYDVTDTVSSGHALNEIEYFDATRTEPMPELASATSPAATTLYSYYTFDGTTDDIGTLGNLAGTMEGDADYATGMFGQALTSDGDGDYFNTNLDAEYDFQFESISFSLWVQLDEDGWNESWETLIAKGDGNTWRLARESGNDTRVKYGVDGGAGDADITDGEWHNFVVTQTVAGDTEIFFDGQSIATNVGNLLSADQGYDLWIGNNPQQTGRSFGGLIDDVGIWEGYIGAYWAMAIYDLAVQPALNYNLGQVDQLAALYRAASGGVVDGWTWEYAAAAPGTPDVFVQLGEDGSGMNLVIGDLTWDGETGGEAWWGFGEGSNSHWDGGAAGDIPLKDTAAYVEDGEVAVTANQDAWSLDVTGGAVTIESPNTLMVHTSTTVASPGTITIDGTLNTNSITNDGTTSLGDGAALMVRGGGGTLTEVALAGSGTVDIAGDVTAVNLTMVDGGHTFTKDGEGTLSFTQDGASNDIYPANTIQVTGGVLFMQAASINPIGGAELEIDGGKFTVRGEVVIIGGVVPEGAVANWAFDDGPTSTTAADSAGGHTGTLTNMDPNTDWVAGNTGLAGDWALDFDGTDDFVEMMGYTGITGSQPRTTAAWIKTTDENGSILSWGTNSAGEKWIFRTQNSNGTDGAIRTEVNDGYIVGSTDVTDDQWHHVVMVLPEGETNVNQMLIYVDGVLESPSASLGEPITTASDADVRIGTCHSDRYFDGLIDEVYIYDFALDADQVAQLYAAGAITLDAVDMPDTDITVTAAGSELEAISDHEDGATFGTLTIGSGNDLTTSGAHMTFASTALATNSTLTIGDGGANLGATTADDGSALRGVMTIPSLHVTGDVSLDGGGLTVGQLSQSVFSGMPRDDTAVNLDGAGYDSSDTRVFTGDKAGTILDPGSYTDEYSGLATSQIQNWNTFPGFGGGANDFVTAFSGVFVPSETGTYTIRGAHDDRGMSYIDINGDGVFDASERMGSTYDNDGDASWTLTEGQPYSIILMAHEYAGSQSVNWYITPPGGAEDRVDPSDPIGNGGQWATVNDEIRAYSDLTMAAGSSLRLTLGGMASFENISAGDGASIIGIITLADNGLLEPGGSGSIPDTIGELTITGDFTMGLDTTYRWESDTLTSDLVVVTGDLDLSAAWTLDLYLEDFVGTGTYDLFTYGGDLTGGFPDWSNVTITESLLGGYVDLNPANTYIETVGNSVVLNLTSSATPFIAVANADWSVGSTWLPNTIAPGVNNATYVRGNRTVTVTEDDAEGASLAIGNPGWGTVIIAPGAILTIAQDVDILQGDSLLDVDGTLNVGGDVNLTADGGMPWVAHLEIEGTVNVVGDVNLSADTRMTVDGTLNADGLIAASGATVKVNGTISVDSIDSGTMMFFFGVGGTLEVGAGGGDLDKVTGPTPVPDPPGPPILPIGAQWTIDNVGDVAIDPGQILLMGFDQTFIKAGEGELTTGPVQIFPSGPAKKGTIAVTGSGDMTATSLVMMPDATLIKEGDGTLNFTSGANTLYGNNTVVVSAGELFMDTDGTSPLDGAELDLGGGLFHVGSGGGGAPTGTIIWVTENTDGSNPPSPDDVAFTDLLTAQGYTVDRRSGAPWQDLDQSEIDDLNAADLVIVSRDGSSGEYDDGTEVADWNGITTPMIQLNSYLVRNNRWKWLDTGGQDGSGDGVLEVVDTGHEIFDGVTLDGSDQVDIATSTTPTSNATDVGNGELLAIDPDNNKIAIAYWEEGTEFYSGSGQIAGGDRMFFGAGLDENNPKGGYNLTADGQIIFLNAVYFMAFPPPVGTLDMTDTDVTAYADTASQILVDMAVDFGDLEIQTNADLTTQGKQITFPSITAYDGSTLITDNTVVATTLILDSGATFTKDGDGLLEVTSPTNTINAGSTVDVAAGELLMQAGIATNPMDAGGLTLSGGTFTVQGEVQTLPTDALWAGRFQDGNFQQNFSAGGGSYTDIGEGIFSGQQLLSGTPGMLETQTGALSYGSTGAFNTFWGTTGDPNQWQAVWTGYFVAQEDGVHDFRIQNAGGGGIDNDGSLWIDYNQNGRFDPGEGGTTGDQLTETTTALVAGQEYAVAFGFNENTGGESYRVQFREPAGGTYDSWTTVDPSTQAGMWRVDVTATQAIDMTATDVLVTDISTLNAITSFTADFGALTLVDGGILTTSGAAGGITFSTTITTGGTAGFETLVNTTPGAIDGGGNAATIVKTGSSNLILNDVGTGLAGTTFEVQEGNLVVENDGTINPLGAGDVELNGGTLALTITSGVADDGGTETFDYALEVTDDSTLTAGMHADGLMGAKTAIFGGTNGLLLSSGFLNVNTTHNYNLVLDGAISGTGVLSFDEGADVEITTGGSSGLRLRGDFSSITGLENLTIVGNLYLDPTVATPTMTYAADITGSIDVHIGNDDVVDGLVILTGTNDYTGTTRIARSVLRIDDVTDLAPGNLRFDSNNRDQIAVLETSGTFTRDIGQNAGEVYWQGEGGFAARGGDLIVTLEGGSEINWGNGNTGFNGQDVQFGSTTANGMVELTNDINLGGGNRRIQVANNTNTKDDFLRLSGVIRGSNDGNDLRFNESSGNNFNGALVELTGTNTYQQVTRIDDATVFAIEGVGLPTDSTIRFDGGANDREAIFMSNGTMEREIGDGPGEVYWDGDPGGFAARGGSFTITLEGGAELDWGDQDSGFDGEWVQMGSQYADSMVELTNDIDLGGSDRRFQIADNPDVQTDFVRISGNIRGSDANDDLRFSEDGDNTFRGGLVELTGTNTYEQRTRIDDATVFAIEGVGLPTDSNLLFSGNSDGREAIFMSNGTMEREIGDGPGEVSWDNAGDPDGQRGGFAARGGAFTVTLEGGNTLNWGSGTTGFDGRRLQLNSQYADDVVTITNDIDGGNGNRDVQLFDNPDVDTDRAVWTGDVYNLKRFRMYGAGTLEIAAGATMSLDGSDNGADFQVRDSTTLIVNGTLNIRDDMPVTGNGATLGGSGTINAYSIAGNTSFIEIQNGEYIAPGDGGVGTLTFELSTGDELEIENNATYLWEIDGSGNDMIALSDAGLLDLRNGWNLDMMDLGGLPGILLWEEYDLFTLSEDVTLQLHGAGQTGSGVVTNFDITGVPTGWDTSGLGMYYEGLGTNDGRIYLTGMEKLNDFYTADDGEWNTAATWDSPLYIPLDEYAHAHVLDTHDATVEGLGREAARVTIEDGGSLAIQSGGELTVGIETRVESGGVLTVETGGELNAQTLTSAGVLTVQTGGELNTQTLTSAGTTTLEAGSTGTLDTVNVIGGTTTVRTEVGTGLLDVTDLTISDAGTLDTDSNITVGNSLTLDGGTLIARGEVDVVVGGTDDNAVIDVLNTPNLAVVGTGTHLTLDIGDISTPIFGRLDMSGFMIGGRNDAEVEFESAGSLLDETPVGTTIFAGNFDISGDAAFRALIPEITRNDDYQTLFEGFFKTTSAGDYYFNSNNKDDRVVMYLDLDKDGNFSSNERLTWANEDEWVTLDADTYYRVAFGHMEHGGSSRIHMLFSTPGGEVPSSTNINLTNPAHQQFFATGGPAEFGDLNMDADTTLTLGMDGTASASFENITTGDVATIEGNVTVVQTVTVATGIGTLTIAGDYTQADGSSYVWEVGDEIHVTGDLSLEDTWDLNPLGTYMSHLNERHTLYTYEGSGVVGDYTLTAGGPNVFCDFAMVGNDQQAKEVYIEGLLITGEPGELLIWDGTPSSAEEEATWSFIDDGSALSHWSTDGTPATRVDYIPTLDRPNLTGHQVQIRSGDVRVKHDVGAYSLDIINDGTLYVQHPRTLEILTRVNVAETAGLRIDGTLDAFAIYSAATTVLGQSGTLKVQGGTLADVTTLKNKATIDVGMGTLTATDLNLAPNSDFIKQGTGLLSFTTGVNSMDDSNTIKVMGGELAMQSKSNGSSPLMGAELELTGSTFTVEGAMSPYVIAAPAGAVANWAFDDGPGSTMATDSAGGYHGTLNNMDPNTVWVQGHTLDPGDYALDFDGSEDFVEAEGYKGVTGSQSRTTAAWIKTTDQDGSIVSWGTNSAGQKWNFLTQDRNGLDGAIRTEVTNGYRVGSTVVADGEWHHVAMVLPGTNANTMLIYVDGQLESPSATGGQAINTASDADVRIGTCHADRYFTGLIDELYVYDRALTAGEIADLYNASQYFVGAVDMSDTDVTVKLNHSSSVINAVSDIGTTFGELTIEHNASLTTRGDDINFAATALDHDSTLTSEGGMITFESIEMKKDSRLVVGLGGADLGELVHSYTSTIETIGDAVASGLASDTKLHISNTLIKTGPGTLTFTGADNKASANLRIDEGEVVMQAEGTLNPLDKARLILNGGTFTVRGAEFDAYAEALFYGTLAGGQNWTEPSPRTSVTSDLAETEEIYTYSSETRVFEGQIYDADGIISFSEWYDNNFWLSIDGNVVLEDYSWPNQTDTGPDPLDIGMGAESDGWHDFELRLGGGGQPNGPVAGSPGFGYDADGGTDWVHPEEVRDGTPDLFRIWTTLNEALDMTYTKVSVTADSVLNAVTYYSAAFGDLSFDGQGILTTQGAQEGISFASTVIRTSGLVGFDTQVDTTPGAIDGSHDPTAVVTIVKTGAADLILNQQGTALSRTTFDVQQGRLVAVGGQGPPVKSGKGKPGPGANINPLGEGIVQLSGAELALTTSADTTAEAPRIFDNTVNVTEDSSITAGAHAGGLAGPQYVEIGSDTNPLSIAEGMTLTLGTTDVYTLTVAGEIHSGNMVVNQGTVQTTGGGSVANLTVSGSTTTLTVVNPEPYSDAGRNLTIEDGGTLALGRTKLIWQSTALPEGPVQTFQVTGQVTETGVQEIILGGGIVTVTGDDINRGGTLMMGAPVVITNSTDVGDGAGNPQPGSFTAEPGTGINGTTTYTVTGSGSDIQDNHDHFHFAYQEGRTGDFDVICRIVGLSGGDDGWRKGGIMARETLDLNSTNVLMSTTPGPDRATCQGRSTTDGGTWWSASSAHPMPEWVRLVRDGTTFTGYGSDDSVNWYQVRSQNNVEMADTIYLGLAVTAHNNNQFTTYTFDDFTEVVGTSVDMSDVHFSLVEGTSTILDLTQHVHADIGDPLPLTYHPGGLSAYLTIEASFDDLPDFQSSWLWDLAGKWDVLEDDDQLSFIVWDDATDWTWDGGSSVGSVTLEFTPMPEPGTLLLLGFGALGILLRKKRRS